MPPRGTWVGPYEVVSALGAGGMGEVYRARDTRLKRDVALKVLPRSFAGDPERLARFAREAEILAALNHPNIAAIYGVEEADGTRALVMELVEGETLADRIGRGPIAVEEALPIARQIAEALEAAHEQGIIHRDLKPANIKLRPDGTVKVLDFGLAKLTDPATPEIPAASGGSMSPTLTSPALMTNAGTLLGTAAYMSPEQAKGRPADKRSDIWAFGCVLYEMLTGRRTFDGEDVADTLAAVLRGAPAMEALPKNVPALIRALIGRCLHKDRRARIGDMSAARFILTEPAVAAASLHDGAPSRRLAVPLLAGAAIVLLILTTVVAIRHVLEPGVNLDAVQFHLQPPPGTNGIGEVELSPDGRSVAFVAPSAASRTIWVRPLDSASARPLTGTDADYFFWSPDGASIAYASNSQVRRVNVRGGPPQILALLPERSYDGTWNAEGVILLGPTTTGGGLLRLDASGGQVAPETRVDTARQEYFHTAPRFLPDGRHYFFLAVGVDPAQTVAYVGRLGSAERRALRGIASKIEYSPTGHVVFLRQGALMAQPFDEDRLELVGDAFPVNEIIAAPAAVRAPFSVARNGTFAFRSLAARSVSRLVWFDRTGKQLGEAAPNGVYVNPELSPDERYVAFDDGSGASGDVRVLDLKTGLVRGITTHPALEGIPQWSPNSDRLLFRSDRDGVGNLYERQLDGVGDDTLVLNTRATKTPYHWSADGRYALYEENDDIWALPMFGNRQPLRVTESADFELNARLSPDGRWIAYQVLPAANAGAASSQVFVQSFPEPRVRKQVSARGGLVPRWNAAGDELYYLAPDRMLMRVSIRSTAATIEVDAPAPVFKMDVSSPTARTYSVARDGRFLVRLVNDEQPPSPITVFVNWGQTLR